MPNEWNLKKYLLQLCTSDTHFLVALSKCTSENISLARFFWWTTSAPINFRNNYKSINLGQQTFRFLFPFKVKNPNNGQVINFYGGTLLLIRPSRSSVDKLHCFNCWRCISCNISEIRHHSYWKVMQDFEFACLIYFSGFQVIILYEYQTGSCCCW